MHRSQIAGQMEASVVPVKIPVYGLMGYEVRLKTERHFRLTRTSATMLADILARKESTKTGVEAQGQK